MSGESFVEYVLDQLHRLGPLDARAMFGAHGLYHAGVFFAIIASGRLFLKTDERTRPDFESRGMRPFKASRRLTLKNYYEVPVDILEDDEELAAWARRAVECAAR
jgi:DNA transformation protein